MGYYTKLKLRVKLSNNAPLDILRGLCDKTLSDKLYIDKFGRIPDIICVSDTPNLPIEHEFGKTHRWDQIFFNAKITLDNILSIKCEIKEYEDDYTKLINWLKPYIIEGKAKSKGEADNQWFKLL